MSLDLEAQFQLRLIEVSDTSKGTLSRSQQFLLLVANSWTPSWTMAFKLSPAKAAQSSSRLIPGLFELLGHLTEVGGSSLKDRQGEDTQAAS